MSSLPAGALPLLPDEIVIWEILVHLPPKSLLRCRAVCRAWRQATSTPDFLMAHHARQPNLPIFYGGKCVLGVIHGDILAFDHRAGADAWLHTVGRLERAKFHLEASCNGLFLLSKLDRFGERESPTCLSICNPATREHASVWPLWDFKTYFRTLGLYPHCPTGEYRLLLQRQIMEWNMATQDCYVFALGSNQQARYIGWRETSSGCFSVPVLVRDSLHWYPAYCPCKSSNHIIVFDTIAELFRQMRPPIVPVNSYYMSIFEMDGRLSIQSHDSTGIIDIWVLHNYESEVWDIKYHIILPIKEITRKFPVYGCWVLDLVSKDSGVLLLVSFGWYLFRVDSDGKLMGHFSHRSGRIYRSKFQLKQSLVQHTFFPPLEDYSVNDSPLFDSS